MDGFQVRNLQTSRGPFSGSMLVFGGVPSLKLTTCPWKWMVEILVDYWGWPIFKECTRWFNSWPFNIFNPLVGGHQQPLKGSLFHHKKHSRERGNISHQTAQTGRKENHWLKSTFGRGHVIVPWRAKQIQWLKSMFFWIVVSSVFWFFNGIFRVFRMQKRGQVFWIFGKVLRTVTFSELGCYGWVKQDTYDYIMALNMLQSLNENCLAHP